MAGNYVDVPSWRMLYDLDGTQLYYSLNGASPIQVSNTVMQQLNDENIASIGIAIGSSDSIRYIFIFPELRDIDAWFMGPNETNGAGSAGAVTVSSNTTNGIDGTWTTLSAGVYGASGKIPMRSNINSATALAVRAISLIHGQNATLGGSIKTIHLYGEPAPGENLQRTEIWHPTLDQRIDPAYLDWGNVPRSSTADVTFRVKNLHPTLQANSITVSTSALTDATLSTVAQHTISQGGSFLAQQTLGSLAPGAISPVLTLRRVTPSNADLSLWWLRLTAVPGSWT